MEREYLTYIISLYLSVTWSSRRPDWSHHETPPHFPPALPPADPGLRGPARTQKEQQEQQRSAQGWQTAAVKRPQQQEQQQKQQHQEQQQQPQQQRATSQGWEVWRGCCAQSQLQSKDLIFYREDQILPVSALLDFWPSDS